MKTLLSFFLTILAGLTLSACNQDAERMILDSEHATPAPIDLSSSDIIWEDFGAVILQDGVFAGRFDVDPSIVWLARAETYQVPDGPRLYRIISPYNNANLDHGPDEYGIWPADPYNHPDYVIKSHTYMVISVNGPDEVYMEPFAMGLDWGYGEFAMGPANGNLPGTYPNGYYNPGVITFPARSLFLYVPATGYHLSEAPTVIYFSTEDYLNNK